MCIELIEEVHDGVRMQSRRAHNHMLLALRPMRWVAPPQFLSFHPGEGQLLELGSGGEGNGIQNLIEYQMSGLIG